MLCVRASVRAPAAGPPMLRPGGESQPPRDREQRVGWPSWLHGSLKVKSHSRYVRLRSLGFSELMS